MVKKSGGVFGPRAWVSRGCQPSWITPEPGMQTGILDGKVVGHVIVARGGYIAFDSVSATVGRFDTLSEAQRAAVAARG